MENEVYLFAVTAVNQVGESMINSSIMIRTNESRKPYSDNDNNSCVLLYCVHSFYSS